MTTIFRQGQYCCMCFYGITLTDATWDWCPDEPHWTLVDVCRPCRINETYQIIRQYASY